jgi:hypothetical protein
MRNVLVSGSANPTEAFFVYRGTEVSLKNRPLSLSILSYLLGVAQVLK